jgi:hypothetical protein
MMLSIMRTRSMGMIELKETKPQYNLINKFQSCLKFNYNNFIRAASLYLYFYIEIEKQQ